MLGEVRLTIGDKLTYYTMYERLTE